METEKFDVVIVGTGVAGLFCALSLPEDFNILLITKDAVENSDSYLAQGGISALKGSEDFELYYEDTMRAGRYENNKESVKIMIQNSTDVIQKLIEYGVEFDKNEDESISYTREGAHSTYRILHHKDITGKEITSKLIARVKERSNIILREYAIMLDLLVKDNRCFGIILEEQNNKKAVFCKSVILATGGLGGLFIHSTNFSHITGDSFAVAVKHKIELEHLNYIQIHPTTLYSNKSGRRFLISESVRGEGAVLLNPEKKRFVDELLPRNVVTEAIKIEMDKYQADYVYLSVRHLETDKIKLRFPNIYQRCLEEGYDFTQELIPVTPAQHYLMGGIKTTVYGETSMKSLYAVGETACNGVHGANRLASNSLLESLVFAERAAQKIKQTAHNIKIQLVDGGCYTEFDKKEWLLHNRKVIMNEIKRRDSKFYDKWCNDENTNGPVYSICLKRGYYK